MSGNKYFEQSKFPEAVIEYRNAVQIDPGFGAARARLAESYAHLGQNSSALNEYVRAADLLQDRLDLQLTAGRYLLVAGRFDETAGRADSVLKHDPGNVEAHVLRGNALAGLKDFDRALNDIEEAIRLDPARGTTYAHLGFVELARGGRDNAEGAFKRAVALAPDWVDGHLALGNFYWAAGRPGDAEQSFNIALRLDPKQPVANRAMAALCLSTGRAAEAEQYLKRIAEQAPSSPAVLALADYYQAVGRTTDAIHVLEPLAVEKTRLAGVTPRLAQAYAATGERKKAHALVDAVLTRNPHDTDAQLVKSQLLSDEGRPDAAFDQVRSAVDANPASVGAQFALGKLYAARGDTAAAEKAYREVLSLNPHVTAAQVELSKMQLASGHTAESLGTAREASENQPKSVEVRLTLARALLATRDLTGAEREIRALLADFPKLAAAHVLHGFLQGERKNLPAARAAFTEALALDADSLEAVAGLTALDLSARDFEAAKARIDARVASGRASPQLLVLAAHTHASAKDASGAERLLRQAIEAEPTSLAAYAMLAQLYLAQERLDEARQEFDNVAQRQSKPVAALTMSGMILQAQGSVAAARTRFTKALAIDPAASVAANNMAWMDAEGGDLDRALQLAQTATTATPDVPEMMDTLGWVYYKKSLPRLAIPLFSRCTEKAPDNPTFHYHLGLAYIDAGEPAEARRSLERALNARPDAATRAEIRRKLEEVPSDVPVRH